jgi:16S rRNA (uracil1498-N3)-methyltransferase
MTDPRPKIRLYVDAPLGPGAVVTPSREQAHYLFGVMRLAAGDMLRLFNGRDGEWRAEVAAAGRRGGSLRVADRVRAQEVPPDLWLLFAPVKKARTDFIVEKAAELGVRRILPVFTRNTASERVNAARLRAHCVEAAEQCGGLAVPELAEAAPLAAVLAGWDPARTLVFCDEARTAPPLAAVAPPPPAAILVGPEGGFAPEEAAALRALRFVRAASLGPRLLRADTAAAAAVALWQAAVGDWGVAGGAFSPAPPPPAP